MREIKDEKDIYNMKLHEEVLLKTDNRPYNGLYIMRVASGWIYTETSGFTMIFVPFDNRFQESNPTR